METGEMRRDTIHLYLRFLLSTFDIAKYLIRIPNLREEAHCLNALG